MFPPVERVIEWKRDYLELQTQFVRAALAALQEKTLGSQETAFTNVIPPQKKRDWRIPPSGAVFRHTGELDSLRVSVRRACDADEKRGEAASLLYETIGQKQTTAAWSWFDDAVFIGDSVSLKLNYYVTKQRQSDSGYMGTAQFLTSGSLGSGNALWDVSSQSVHPTYQGEKMKLEESIPLTGAKKVYIMLGMNDVGMYGPEKSAENLETLLDKIQAKAPGVSFYVQSATPMCKGAEKKALNNDTLTAYNRLVKELCIRRGWHYVDVASVLQDGEGYLPTAYCSDPQGMGIHFTDTACQVWIDYLRTHTD